PIRHEKVLRKSCKCCTLLNSSWFIMSNVTRNDLEYKLQCCELVSNLRQQDYDKTSLFSEILGVWLAMRYRNQKDPRANPSAFL
uniref:Uncharacterized protein n=1 Tax=Astyanax mexicanus TaxID=7994 RepID=A0A8B9KE81_ASTMX